MDKVQVDWVLIVVKLLRGVVGVDHRVRGGGARVDHLVIVVCTTNLV